MEQNSYQYDSSPTSSHASPTSRHTQFLDLTNGEGGERPQTASYDDEEEEPDHQHHPVVRPSSSGGERGGGASLSSGGGRQSSIAPVRVVESGHEHTGRWTKEEHESFMNALKNYGKEWKKVAAKVKTRTVVQTRTHAQKYFQKLSKAMESKDDITDVHMGVALEAKRAASSSIQKKKPRITPASSSTPVLLTVAAPAPAKPARQTSVTSAAHLISNLSSSTASEVVGATSATAGAFHLPGAAASVAASPGFANPQLPSSLSSGGGHHKSSLFPAQHGFSTFSSSTPSSEHTTFATPFSSAGGSSFIGSKPSTAGGGTTTKAFSSMKIVAPEHDVAMKRGNFPEPSPAACGKRKLAEIAAARMLAGVLSVGRSTAAAMDDGTATPPEEEEVAANNSKASTGGVEMKGITAPPIAAVHKHNNNGSSGSSSLVGRKGLGLSLQIVNPETLGVSYEQQQNRWRDGQGSPVTPWEGQLKALVSEDKKKAPQSQDGSDIPRAPEMMDGFGNSSSCPHPVCGPGAAYNRNPLHKAVCEMDLAVIEFEVSSRPFEFFQRPDGAGFCPIHSACSLCMKNSQNSSIASDIVRMLINAGADATISDSEGNTPLHWAARAGDKGTAELLLLKNSPKDAHNDSGETPLHWAARAGRVGMAVATVLLENGARPAVWSKEFKRPIDVAAEGFQDEEGSVTELTKLINQKRRLSKEQRSILKEAAEQRKEARAHLLKLSVQSRTLVLHHPECLEHTPKSSSDWECPDRVTSIMDRLIGKNKKANTPSIHQHEITISQTFDRAELKVLSRVHSTDYLSFVNDLSKDLERQHKEMNGDKEEEAKEPGTTGNKPPVVPFTPMVQRSMIKVAESNVKLGQHSDTSFSVGSLRAARRAAGAVQHAVDCVLIGRNRNAFCMVRPPGHHAGINGLLAGGESCGFCIFNSVAAGAMHAISDERLLCERCAIVDIDVHHGNGTEEIVRKCHDPGKLFFFSIHLYDNERKKRETKSLQYKFYPGTGAEDDVALNIINVPITPLWKEREQAAPAMNTHNTRNRKRQTRSQERDDGDSSEAGTPKASDAETEPSTAKGVSSGTSTPTNPNATSTNGGRFAYRRAIQHRLLPALRAFNPDLILISAGFDAGKNDVGNAKHEFGGKERMGIDLEPEDYAWTTRKIMEIADICCQGRVVSVLEGGYGTTPPSGSDDSNEPLDKTTFSECAMRHVHAMIDPYDTEARFASSSRNDP